MLKSKSEEVLKRVMIRRAERQMKENEKFLALLKSNGLAHLEAPIHPHGILADS